ncbi:MAG TPA: hydroxymethylbilane synthase [Chthoniobacterales bacterium]|nr:hydroxymethylbilane synthase [Chthoniobacterales bacterium]
MRRLVLGTRGSELARAQTALVADALHSVDPGIEVDIEIITTRGDEGSAPVDRRAGRKGLFTSEIERALLEGKIDVAVHSAKDLPSEMTSGLTIAAVLPRARVDDVLVTKQPADLMSVSTVATGSVRRQYQLRALRPDLDVVELRGNVPTRLRKLLMNDWDGVVLARAGLERLGFDCTAGTLEFEGRRLQTAPLPQEHFLPAGGQGIIAIQTRADDAATMARVDHDETHRCLRAEREFLRLLHGDCGTPVGVFALLEDAEMTLRAQVFAEGEFEPKAGMLRMPVAEQQPEQLAAALFQSMYGEK